MSKLRNTQSIVMFNVTRYRSNGEGPASHPGNWCLECVQGKIQLGRVFVHHRISMTKKANRFNRIEDMKGKAKDLNSGYKNKAEFFEVGMK